MKFTLLMALLSFTDARNKDRSVRRSTRRYIPSLDKMDDRVREHRYHDWRRLRHLDRSNSFGAQLHAKRGNINSRLRRLSKRAYRSHVKYPNYRAALRQKKQVVEAVPIDIVENEKLYNYNVYLLPMGRRVTAQIPSSPDQIGTQFGEYKVNMNGRFYTIQCKKSHPSATNQLICDYRTKKMMSRYSQSSYVPEKSSKYYYLKNLKKAPTNNPDWRKYLKVV